MTHIKEYILQNWAMILILAAFAIMLRTSIFSDKKVVRRMYFLIGFIFALSVVVFIEFYLEEQAGYAVLRSVLMAIRYSATPFILAFIIYALVKRQRAFIFIPALALAATDVVSIFTGIVFSVSEDNTFTRGPLGYLPFIVAGLYGLALVVLLIKVSNKRAAEIIQIVFLGVAISSGLVFPFVFGKDFSQIFCTTIAIALFVYYVFSILQLTKKDALTGLLNRQAYFADVSGGREDITAIVSLDMNGLKATNDTYGHAAGDEALVTLALCFMRAARSRQSVYRVGGDEFLIVCRKSTLKDVEQLVERIEKFVSDAGCSCSIGYSHSSDKSKSVDDMLKESDEMMYSVKARYYREKKEEKG